MAAKDPVYRHEVQHDLRFHDSNDFGGYISIKDVKNPALHNAWYTFQHNVESVRVMMELPHAIVSDAINYLIPVSQAIFNVVGKPVLDDAEHTEATLLAIREELERIYNHFFATRPQTYLKYQHGLWEQTNRNLSWSMLTRGGLFALMESQLIGAWTAFSTFTTELLVAAVSERPKCLHNMQKQKVELSVLLDAGDDHDWNGRMGELARIFFRLDSFKETTDAYDRLFMSDDIVAPLRLPVVKMASLVRNQCVHNSCKATPTFIKEARKLKMEPWQSVQVGDYLPINGYDIAAQSEGVVQAANELVRAMDRWLGMPAQPAPTPPSQDQ